jgi:hypothetical protein
MGMMKNIDVIKQERCATTLADDEKMVAEQYAKNGFENRDAYIAHLAEVYGQPKVVVWQAARLFGAVEDFDGLVSFLDELPMM